MRAPHSELVKFIVVILIFFPWIGGAPHHKKAVSLYGVNDTLTQLDSTNLNTTLYNKSHAFIVEFYSSWCGHCISFAPTWKKLASETYQWSNVIRVAAINCASEENFPVCTSFEVRGFPAIKFFPAFADSLQKGLEVKDGDSEMSKAVAHYKSKMVDYVEMHLGSQRPESWPVFRRLDKETTRDSLHDLFDDVSVGGIVLVFHATSSLAAKFVTLHLSTDQRLRVFGVDVGVFEKSNPQFLRDFDKPSSPAVFLILPNVKKLWNFRRPKTMIVPLVVNVDDAVALQRRIKELAPWTSVGLAFEPRSPPVVSSTVPPLAPPKGVFLIDLVKVIDYALRHEIGSRHSIEGENLDAVKSFVELLFQHLPGDRVTMDYLTDLNAWLRSRGNRTIESREWLRRAKPLTRADGTKVSDLNWVGCQGSRATLRGYPCAVWTLFHVLSVTAADASRDVNEESGEGRRVLEVMAEYVKRFFGCRVCAEHFEIMIKEDLDDSVQSYDDVILWLWRAHNTVNARLKGHESEDPRSPKIQFPDIDTCPSCRIEGNRDAWHYINVKTFLKNYYRDVSVSTPLSESRERSRSISHDKGTVDQSAPPFANKDDANRPSDDDHLDVERLRIKERQTRRRNGPSSGLGFTEWDVSICFGAYGVSVVVLIALYVIYVDRRCRRNLRRKSLKEAKHLLDPRLLT